MQMSIQAACVPTIMPEASEKYAVIEDIAKDVMDELKRQEMTAVDCRDLEKHAYSVNDSIRNAAVRNLHILAAV